MPGPGPHPAHVDERLAAHLRSWLGAWPPAQPRHVVGSGRRTVPGWNGRVRTLAGVATSHGAAPTYLHAADNVASARTADASGFPDVGWTILGRFGTEPD